MKHYKSITKQLLFITTSITMAITLITAIYFYLSYRSILYNSLKQSTEHSLSMLVETIQYDMNTAFSILDFCESNEAINSYLNASNRHQDNTTALAYHAWERLREECRNNSSYSYFNRLLISDRNGEYIQFSPFDIYQNVSLSGILMEQPFFQQLYDNPGSIQTGFIADPLPASSVESLIIPVIRPVYTVYGRPAAGWCYLALSSNIFANRFKSYNLYSDSQLFLTLGDTTYLWKENTFIETDFDLEVLTANQAHYGFSRVPSVVTTSGNDGDWYISQTISRQALAKQTAVFLRSFILIIGIVAALGFAIVVYLHKCINKPVQRLQKKLALIASGDFSADPSIEWNNEFGEIGRGINTMSSDISTLIQSRMEDQEKKFELEYQVLQNQVNPHFLYNTLNSITWMATAQGSRGISEMASSLSYLLKSVSKKSALEHTIREERELLDHYFLIQKYRYGSILTLNYQVEDESLYDCMILKFVFQIIVENAIFHGIGPKETPGVIDIRIEACHEEQDISISITDNGVGMTPELIKQILEQESGSSGQFQKIGICNIQKRMQYAYGSDYGISIESTPGQYTKVTVIIPRKPKEDSEHV